MRVRPTTRKTYVVKGLSFWFLVGWPWLIGVIFIIKSTAEAI